MTLSCSDKIKYQSKAEAIKAHKRMKRKYNSLKPYKCQLCGMFHLGRENSLKWNSRKLNRKQKTFWGIV